MFEFLKSLFATKPFQVPISCFDEKDDRNFGAHVIAGTVTRDDMPKSSFIIFDPTQIDQAETDFCVNCSLAYNREQTEQTPLSWCFNFAMYLKDNGLPIGTYGANIKSLLMTGIKWGTPTRKSWDYVSGKRDWFANAGNVPQSVIKEAVIHKAGSLFECLRPFGWDRFDTSVAYMNKLRQLVSSGVSGHANTQIGFLKAGDSFKDVLFNCTGKVIDWDIKFTEDRSIAKDSYLRGSMNYTEGVYKEGYRFFTKADVNKFFGLYMMTDIPKDIASLLNQYDGKAIKASVPAVYLMVNGKKCHIPSEEAAWSWGISLWKDIVKVGDDEIKLIPEGPELDLKAGKFYQLLNEIVNSPEIVKRVEDATKADYEDSKNGVTKI